MTEIMKLGGGGRFTLNPAYVNWDGADRTCRPTAMQALFGVAGRCAELRADSRYPQPSIRGEYLSAPWVRVPPLDASSWHGMPWVLRFAAND